MTAVTFADQIQANVDEYYAKRIDYAEFHTIAFQLWDAAEAAGLVRSVSEELLRREKRAARTA
jgi:hypothetical protein